MSESGTFIQPQPPSVPNAPGRRGSPRRVRLAGYAVGVVLAVGLAALGLRLVTALRDSQSVAGVSQPVAAAPDVSVQPVITWERPVVSDDGLVERSGVRIVYVALTGGGGLIDLRFQVVDPSKAVVVHDAATPPAVVDEATGLVAANLLMGHSHSGNFNSGQTYYLIFENPGNLVQRGSTVSVLLGDAEVDHVEVK